MDYLSDYTDTTVTQKMDYCQCPRIFLVNVSQILHPHFWLGQVDVAIVAFSKMRKLQEEEVLLKKETIISIITYII